MSSSLAVGVNTALGVVSATKTNCVSQKPRRKEEENGEVKVKISTKEMTKEKETRRRMMNIEKVKAEP